MCSLTVMTYNVMLVVPEPLRFCGQKERAARIGPAILKADSQKPIDVVVFIELMAPQQRACVLAFMREHGWSYQTQILTHGLFDHPSSLKVVSGGIVIVSKYPILSERSVAYLSGQGLDAMAYKGAVAARIQKDKAVFHVVGTHLQAWDTPECSRIRTLQIQELAVFLDFLDIPVTEPVLLTGDFNVDFYTKPEEIKRLVSVLDCSVVQMDEKSSRFTSDPRNNSMVGNDDSSMYKTAEFPRGCYAQYLDAMTCMCCPQELTEYTFIRKKHTQPLAQSVRVEFLKADAPFDMFFNASIKRQTADLSDHFPLVSALEFPLPPEILENYEYPRLPSALGFVSPSNVWFVLFIAVSLALAFIITLVSIFAT